MGFQIICFLVGFWGLFFFCLGRKNRKCTIVVEIKNPGGTAYLEEYEIRVKYGDLDVSGA